MVIFCQYLPPRSRDGCGLSDRYPLKWLHDAPSKSTSCNVHLFNSPVNKLVNRRLRALLVYIILITVLFGDDYTCVTFLHLLCLKSCFRARCGAKKFLPTDTQPSSAHCALMAPVRSHRRDETSPLKKILGKLVSVVQWTD